MENRHVPGSEQDEPLATAVAAATAEHMITVVFATSPAPMNTLSILIITYTLLWETGSDQEIYHHEVPGVKRVNNRRN